MAPARFRPLSGSQPLPPQSPQFTTPAPAGSGTIFLPPQRSHLVVCSCSAHSRLLLVCAHQQASGPAGSGAQWVVGPWSWALSGRQLPNTGRLLTESHSISRVPPCGASAIDLHSGTTRGGRVDAACVASHLAASFVASDAPPGPALLLRRHRRPAAVAARARHLHRRRVVPPARRRRYRLLHLVRRARPVAELARLPQGNAATRGTAPARAAAGR